MTIFEMLLRVGAGVERQFRTRLAGLRTNALVAVGVNVVLRPLGRGVDRRPEAGDETARSR